jgi:hypothetical protein
MIYDKKVIMDRRNFLFESGSLVAATAWRPSAMAQSTSSATAELTLREISGASRIPETYTGLSYELAQLTDPTPSSPRPTAILSPISGCLSPQWRICVSAATPASSAGSETQCLNAGAEAPRPLRQSAIRTGCPTASSPSSPPQSMR